ncbi:hypothetical protein ABT272_37610 [Streptomyces sp900105245]|uniref:Uncharacterized protein n=1 Tax=Streptomyces sp. 900105245 TaxID=3154379 RepID=A0ABV1UI45_9ACTN
MRRDGCPDEVSRGRQRNLGVDVKATDPLRRVLGDPVQARAQRLSAVGTPDLQILSGTARQIRVADVAVIMTKERFTTRRGLRQTAAAAGGGPSDTRSTLRSPV